MLEEIYHWSLVNLPSSLLVPANLLLVVVTSIYVYFTYRMSKTMADESRRTATSRLHEVLWRLKESYSSVEMLLAIDSLYCFHDDCEEKGKNFVEEYEKMRHAEFRLYRLKPLSQQKAFAAETLHTRRRIVKNFYQFLAALREIEPDSARLIYNNWSEADLRIIPKILIPIEESLAKTLGTYSQDFEAAKSRLEKLYEGGKK